MARESILNGRVRGRRERRGDVTDRGGSADDDG